MNGAKNLYYFCENCKNKWNLNLMDDFRGHCPICYSIDIYLLDLNEILIRSGIPFDLLKYEISKYKETEKRSIYLSRNLLDLKSKKSDYFQTTPIVEFLNNYFNDYDNSIII
jgi:hypothetical protein